jgi:hypothetical protein
VKVVDGVTLVEKIMSKNFLFHGKPTAGSYLRAYNIDWDPHNPEHAIMASESGIYTSDDGGKTWKRFTNKDHEDANHYFPACVGTGKREANAFLQDNPQVFLPEGPCDPKTSAINSFRTAHFTADGSVLVSGTAGTFLANPFGKGCESSR